MAQGDGAHAPAGRLEEGPPSALGEAAVAGAPRRMVEKPGAGSVSRKKRKTPTGQVQASRWARVELRWATIKAVSDQAKNDALMDEIFADPTHWDRRPPFAPYWEAVGTGDVIGYRHFETLRACVAALGAAGYGSYTLGPHRVRLRSRYVAGDRPPPW